ncbi:ribonuclease III [Naumannella halotolerans]|nr:ribonuclease III [Naumannella halotolerans]
MPDLDQICSELGVQLDPELRVLALTHRSFAYENGGLPTNERLEFLGDSVLGLVVTEHLYRTHPDVPEGNLAKLRAAVVNTRALADVGRSLQIGPQIRLGRGEVQTGGADKSSILADTMESIIGAIYLGNGPEAAARLVHHLFDPLMDSAAHLGAGLDWKTSLQELAAGLEQGAPTYRISESGPDHDKVFQARVVLGEQTFDPGTGRSKKAAEQEAASIAFAVLKEQTEAAREAVEAADPTAAADA